MTSRAELFSSAQPGDGPSRQNGRRQAEGVRPTVRKRDRRRASEQPDRPPPGKNLRTKLVRRERHKEHRVLDRIGLRRGRRQQVITDAAAGNLASAGGTAGRCGARAPFPWRRTVSQTWPTLECSPARPTGEASSVPRCWRRRRRERSSPAGRWRRICDRGIGRRRRSVPGNRGSPCRCGRRRYR